MDKEKPGLGPLSLWKTGLGSLGYYGGSSRRNTTITNLTPVLVFVLVVANGEEQGHMVTTLLKRGDKFGEEEIISLNRRSATVMSQDTVELFVVHGWVKIDK